MKTCPSCEASIPESAAVCPSCQHELESESETHRTLMGFQAQMGEEEEEETDEVESDSDRDETYSDQGESSTPEDETSGSDSGQTLMGLASVDDSSNEASPTSGSSSGSPGPENGPVEFESSASTRDDKDEGEPSSDDASGASKSTHFGMPVVDEDEGDEAPHEHESEGESGELDSFLQAIDISDVEETDDESQDAPDSEKASDDHDEQDPNATAIPEPRRRQDSQPSADDSGMRYSTQLGMPSSDEGDAPISKEPEYDDRDDARSTYDLADESENDVSNQRAHDSSNTSDPSEPSSPGDGSQPSPPDEPRESSNSSDLSIPPPSETSTDESESARETAEFTHDDTPESGIVRFSAEEEEDSEAPSQESEAFQGGASGIIDVPEEREQEEASADESSPDRDRSEQAGDSASTLLGGSTYMQRNDESSGRGRADTPSSTPEHELERAPSDASPSTQEGLTDQSGPTGFDVDRQSQDLQLDESLEDDALSSLGDASTPLDELMGESPASDLSSLNPPQREAERGQTPDPTAQEAFEPASDFAGGSAPSNGDRRDSREAVDVTSTPAAGVETLDHSEETSQESEPLSSEAESPDEETVDSYDDEEASTESELALDEKALETQKERPNARSDSSPADESLEVDPDEPPESSEEQAASPDRASRDEPSALELESPEAPPVGDQPSRDSNDASEDEPLTATEDETSAPTSSTPEGDDNASDQERDETNSAQIVIASVASAGLVGAGVWAASPSIGGIVVGFGIWFLLMAGFAYGLGD